jgi:hypothetical protein
MPLTKKFADEFSHTAQAEGEKIFHRGGVKFDDHQPEYLEATVEGGQPYSVYLSREKGAVRYACDCPHYTSTGSPCKHVWATLLAAEKDGYVDQWKTDRHLDLLPDDDDFDDEPASPYSRNPLTALLSLMAKPGPGRSSGSRRKRGTTAEWKQTLGALREAMQSREKAQAAGGWPPGREVLYIVDVPRTLEGHGLTIEVDSRERRKDGNWGKPKKQAVRSEEIATLPDLRDREILSLLHGAKSARDTYSSYYYSSYDQSGSSSSFRLGSGMQTAMVQRMCDTGRCLLRIDADQELLPLAWDDGGTWELWIVARQAADAGNFILTGELRRGEQRMDMADPTMLVAGGLVFTREKVAPLDEGGAFPWVGMLRAKQELLIPAADREELLRQLLSLPALPRLDLPEELKVEEVRLTPTVRLRVRKPAKKAYYQSSERLRGELSFDYEGIVVSDDEPGRGIYQPERRRLILRDSEFEREAVAKMRAAGFKRQSNYYDEHPGYELAPNNLPGVIRKLTAENWHVEADGQLYRQPGEIKIDVTSGIDWFELHGTADFGGQSVKLPELLAAMAPSAFCPSSGSPSTASLPTWEPPPKTTFALAIPRLACSMPCWHRSRRRLAMQCSSRRAIGCGILKAFAPPIRRLPSSAAFGLISARGWGGWNSCANFGLEVVLPTTWGWARRCRCWRCWRNADCFARLRVMALRRRTESLPTPPLTPALSRRERGQNQRLRRRRRGRLLSSSRVR